MVSGIRNVESGGGEGQNARFENTTGMLAMDRQNGWMRGGAGPGVDAVHFQVPASGPPAAVNALWMSVLTDFGEWGLAALAALILTAVWRMRRDARIAALLLPFIVASMVNTSSATATPGCPGRDAVRARLGTASGAALADVRRTGTQSSPASRGWPPAVSRW